MISICNSLRSAVTLCAILTAGIAVAQDGIVRISDRSTAPAGTTQQGVRLASLSAGGGSCGSQGCTEGCATTGQCCPGTTCGNCGPCSGGMCGTCYLPTSCNHIFAPCDGSGMPAAWCRDCGCYPCQCNGGHRRNGQCESGIGWGSSGGRDYQNTVFAHSVDSGSGSACRDFWHGQSMSFRNKNARLADCLFGWMIPSGCCGQGCPPVGHYQVVYADQPGYIDPRDTQMYAAQGYGMPMAVPLAPNVNHTYNYSAGLPASRVTHIGNYNPQTSVAPLYHQSW